MRTFRIPVSIVAGLAITLLCASPSHARGGDDVTTSDLEAVAHSIGFLENLPGDGAIVVGIVYTDGADGRSKASQAAAILSAIPGPGKTQFRTVLVAAKDLAQAPGRLDAVILMPNVANAAGEIAGSVRRRRIVSISTDTACLDAKCCVLMVQTSGRVRIVLDTELADAVGAHFSSIFTMMVERR